MNDFNNCLFNVFPTFIKKIFIDRLDFTTVMHKIVTPMNINWKIPKNLNL